MGEMTIRNLDDELARSIAVRAEQSGVSVEAFVVTALERAVRETTDRTLPVARAILSRHTALSPISSVDLLDEIRDGGR